MKQDTLQIQYEDCMIRNVLFVVTSSGVAFFLLNCKLYCCDYAAVNTEVR